MGTCGRARIVAAFAILPIGIDDGSGAVAEAVLVSVLFGLSAVALSAEVALVSVSVADDSFDLQPDKPLVINSDRQTAVMRGVI